MKVNLLTVPAAIAILAVGISCQQAATSNVTNNQTHALPGISINTNQTEMIGMKALDFELNDIKGNPVSLSDFQGKPVLLVFWATWSQDSQREMPVIQQVNEQWQSKGLVILTIDILNSRPDETQANLEDFLSKNGYTFPVLLDPNQLATIQYHVGVPPTNFFIDREGIIREIAPGPFLSLSAVEASLTRILPQ